MIPELNTIYNGDSLDVMRQWPDAFVQTVVTSPPYWGLRDYGTGKWEGGDARCNHSTSRSRGDDIKNGDKQGTSKGSRPNTSITCLCGATRIDSQIGLESTPDTYVKKMVEVFREVKRVLRDDGTLWLNLGDSYSSFRDQKQVPQTIGAEGNSYPGHNGASNRNPEILKACGLKHKDMVGIPWRVAFALQADGWYLRSDIIWSKPNPMPESVTDRPTKAHEYLFLLTKNERYYYNSDAIKEPAIYMDLVGQDASGYKDAESFNGKHRKPDKQRGHGRRHAGFNDRWDLMEKAEQCSGMRNKRSVWTVATYPYPEAHFATFPPDLIKPCILAGSREHDIVLDPFMGAGTTAFVASQYNRQFIGTELNQAYIRIAETRIANEQSQIKMDDL